MKFVNIKFGNSVCLAFSGYTEALDDSSDIVVPQDDYGLYAIDILDPSLVLKSSSMIKNRTCFFNHIHSFFDQMHTIKNK